MSLRPLPRLDDAAAMAKLGRLAAIRSARLDAMHDLRDCSTQLQRADIDAGDQALVIATARSCLDRIEELQRITDAIG
jgi:hypothetical protein